MTVFHLDQRYDEVFGKIAMQERSQAEVMARLLALCFAKPLETFNEMPTNWMRCSHVSLETDNQWPDLERELLPMLNNLSGYLAHKCVIPTDICIVRRPGQFVIVAEF